MADKIKIVVVDFDGTLRNTDTGAPIDAMVKVIKQRITDGCAVMILAEKYDEAQALLEQTSIPREDVLIVEAVTAAAIDEFWSSRAVQI